jgi:hypothetical protein
MKILMRFCFAMGIFLLAAGLFFLFAADWIYARIPIICSLVLNTAAAFIKFHVKPK